MGTYFLIAIMSCMAVYRIIKHIRFHMEDRRLRNEIHRLEMLHQRRSQLYYFQLRMINMFGADVIDAIPNSDVIMASDKPIQAKFWVNIDKLVNLN